MNRGPLEHGLMPKQHGYPGASRDWQMPDVPCTVVGCLWNSHDNCSMPSVIEIGPGGVCLEFARQKEKEAKKRAESKGERE